MEKWFLNVQFPILHAYDLNGMTLSVGGANVDSGVFTMTGTTDSETGNEGKNAVFTFTNAKKEEIKVKNAENAKCSSITLFDCRFPDNVT